MADLPDELAPPTSVSISIADLKISEAQDITSDGDAYYIRTMPPILDRLRVTYAEYWSLTVAEHQTMVDYLNNGGEPGG